MSPAPPPPKRFHHVHRVAAIALAILGLSLGAGSVDAGEVPDYDFDWVVVGDPGNPPYPGNAETALIPPLGYTALRGSVPYTYRMSRLELTAAQWAEFLNAFRSLVPVEFEWTPGIVSTVGINPDPDGERYVPRTDLFGPDADEAPVLGVTHRIAMQYCNWLHNDKEISLEALETGAYDLSALNGTSKTRLTDARRLPGARFWIPSLDEWLKAVHYDPDKYGSGAGGWWEYPYGSDKPPVSGPPENGGQTNAGLLDLQFSPRSPLFRLGLYPNAVTPWGLLDASGGGRELIEDLSSNDEFASQILDGTSLAQDSFKDGVFDAATRSGTIIDREGALRIASAVRDTGPGDVNRDGRTDAFDLGAVISQWGQCLAGLPPGLVFTLSNAGSAVDLPDIRGTHRITVQLLEDSDTLLSAVSIAGIEERAVSAHFVVEIRDDAGRRLVTGETMLPPDRRSLAVILQPLRLRSQGVYTIELTIETPDTPVASTVRRVEETPPFNLVFDHARLLAHSSSSVDPLWPQVRLWRMRGAPICAADIDRDLVVSLTDLVAVLNGWSSSR